MDNSKKEDERLPDKVSLEYQKAQDSAEHYNTMIWTLISVGIALSLVILYKVLSEDLGHLLELTLVFIGTFTLFYFSYLIETANERKNFKYGICKKIEESYGFMGQNKGVESLPISSNEKGMYMLRWIKLMLFCIYFMQMVATGIIVIFKEPGFAPLTTLSLAIFLPLTIIAMFIEINYYWNHHGEDKIKKKQK